MTEAYVRIGMTFVLYKRVNADGSENSEKFRVIRPRILDALETVFERVPYEQFASMTALLAKSTSRARGSMN